MIEILGYTGNGYKPLINYQGWRVAMLNYDKKFSKVEYLERHTETDEVFVLLEGQASLFAAEAFGEPVEYKMELGKIYNIKKNIWHHIVVTPETRVLIVENSDTGSENTERKMITK